MPEQLAARLSDHLVDPGRQLSSQLEIPGSELSIPFISEFPKSSLAPVVYVGSVGGIFHEDHGGAGVFSPSHRVIAGISHVADRDLIHPSTATEQAS